MKSLRVASPSAKLPSTLPDGAGRLVVAVFVRESARDVVAQERAIAQIARAAYDYFAFNPGPITR